MKIDVNRNDDIERWAKRLGVTRTRLIAAVAASGPRVDDVAARIRREQGREREAPPREPNRRVAFHAFD